MCALCRKMRLAFAGNYWLTALVFGVAGILLPAFSVSVSAQTLSATKSEPLSGTLSLGGYSSDYIARTGNGPVLRVPGLNFSGLGNGRPNGTAISLPPASGIALNTPTADDPSLYWLQFDSRRTNDNGVAAQFGLGYAPRPDIGISVGPVFELNGPIGNSFGFDGTADTTVTPTHRPGPYGGSTLSYRDIGNRPDGSDDAGLSASFSFMAFEDIWVGLQGQLTTDIAPLASGNVPGRFDAALGVTAGYRLEF